MFPCIQCSQRFTVEDIKSGLFFISTSTCLGCYKNMSKSRISCFGKEKMYDNNIIACQECPDERICRIYIHHKEQFKGE